MANIRTSMKAEAESLKSLVESVTTENMEEVNTIEQSLLKKLNNQETTIEKYITYLNDLDKKFRVYTNPTHTRNNKTSDAYQSGRLWVSECVGNLVQTDLQGNQLQKIRTSGVNSFHPVTQDGDLIFTDMDEKVLKRTTLHNNITQFLETRQTIPFCIHSSHINGDLLVGMGTRGEAKVTRYNKKGKELQNIQRDKKGQGLYNAPYYITENINGDICTCTSDCDKKAVVVVNRVGKHRFSYTCQGSKFRPHGICTDVFGHILVCDLFNVHLLDQDGQFLSLLITPKQVSDPISVLWITRTIFMWDKITTQ
ncbi:uncharacterized protein LOC134241977 [Saccostrea cucullata]|uniref:uncharacterized protein LOC134241977 n=1 Tax=Saccostrea cuccullata TaxID=36930 RepID=UPI002ED0C8F2